MLRRKLSFRCKINSSSDEDWKESSEATRNSERKKNRKTLRGLGEKSM